MLAIIFLFILFFNIISIALMYYCLGDLTKKEKFIFIAVGTGIMYILTSIVYWISTNGIEITEVSETGKNLITFLFVPVNAILVLPILAKSYSKTKFGSLKSDVFIKRGIVLGILLFIVLIVECNYFKNIQEGVVNLIKRNAQTSIENNSVNEVNENVLNEISSSTNENLENEVNANVLNVVESNSQNVLQTNEDTIGEINE